jgi:hypothetical protein
LAVFKGLREVIVHQRCQRQLQVVWVVLDDQDARQCRPVVYLRRYMLGVIPVSRLKLVAKWEELAYPQVSAISVRDCRGSASKVLARSIRNRICQRRGGRPVLCRNAVQK